MVLAGDIAKPARAFGRCRALFPALGGRAGRGAGRGVNRRTARGRGGRGAPGFGLLLMLRWVLR